MFSWVWCGSRILDAYAVSRCPPIRLERPDVQTKISRLSLVVACCVLLVGPLLSESTAQESKVTVETLLVRRATSISATSSKMGASGSSATTAS